MKSHSLFALMLFISQTLHAESLCRYSLNLDQARLEFAGTPIYEIEAQLGVAEKFKYGESGGTATCYQADKKFLILGFKAAGDSHVLWNASIPALPPTGYEKSIFKKISSSNHLRLHAHYLGMQKHFSKNFLNETNSITHLQDDGLFECSLAENSIFANGRLIHYFIGLTENN